MKRIVAVVLVGLAFPAAGHAAGVVASDNIFRSPAHPKGYIMLIHGGGFLFVGKPYLETEEPEWYGSHGWATYDIDYRAASYSLPDVIATYDALRRRVGPRAKICAQGQSAGGTLAMLLAADRPKVACVISEGGIANLTNVGNPLRTQISTWALPGRLWAFSPLRVAARIRQPLLMAGSSLDRVVPEENQLAQMKRARPSTQVMLLAGATTPGINFVHANVTTGALRRFHAAELRMLSSRSRSSGAVGDSS